MIEKEQRPTSFIHEVDENIVLSEKDSGSADMFALYSLLEMMHPHVLSNLLRAVMLAATADEDLLGTVLKSYLTVSSAPVSKNTPFADFAQSSIVEAIGANSDNGDDTLNNYYAIIADIVATLRREHTRLLDEDAQDDTEPEELSATERAVADDKTIRLRELQLYLEILDLFLEKNTPLFKETQYRSPKAASIPDSTATDDTPVPAPPENSEECHIAIERTDTFGRLVSDAFSRSSFFTAFAGPMKEPEKPKASKKAKTPKKPKAVSAAKDDKEEETTPIENVDTVSDAGEKRAEPKEPEAVIEEEGDEDDMPFSELDDEEAESVV